MPCKYIINPELDIIRVNENSFNFRTITSSYSLQDDSGLIALILSDVTGSLDTSTLMARCTERFALPQVEATLAIMKEKHILIEADTAFTLDHSLLYRHSSESPNDSALSDWLIVTSGTGILANTLHQGLASFGFTIQSLDAVDLRTQKSNKTLLLATADHEHFSAFRQLNKQAIEAGLPALYVWLDRLTIRCGPLVYPQSTACFECYYHRVRSSRRFVSEFDAMAENQRLQPDALPSLLSVHWAVAAAMSQIVCHIGELGKEAHLSPVKEGSVLKSTIETSYVLRLPRCAVCGSARHRPPVATFQSALLTAARG